MARETYPSSFPRLDVLVSATVQALKNLGGSASNEEIHDEVVQVLGLPDDIVEIPHKDGNRTYLSYRLHWARSYLKKVEALDNTQRGVWTLTPAGRAMSADELGDVVRIVRSLNYEERKRKVASRAKETLSGEGDEEEVPRDWTEELLTVLGRLPADAFERLCQRILREAGFTKVEVSGRSGDGGIDGHGILRVNLVSFQVLFQSKRWKGSVGPNVVRDFRGAMVGRADKGLIITTGTFTKDARAEATRDGAPAIDLVDGDDLCQLMKDLKLGVKVRLVEEVDVDEAALAAI